MDYYCGKRKLIGYCVSIAMYIITVKIQGEAKIVDKILLSFFISCWVLYLKEAYENVFIDLFIFLTFQKTYVLNIFIISRKKGPRNVCLLVISELCLLLSVTHLHRLCRLCRGLKYLLKYRILF